MSHAERLIPNIECFLRWLASSELADDRNLNDERCECWSQDSIGRCPTEGISRCAGCDYLPCVASCRHGRRRDAKNWSSGRRSIAKNGPRRIRARRRQGLNRWAGLRRSLYLDDSEAVSTPGSGVDAEGSSVSSHEGPPCPPHMVTRYVDRRDSPRPSQTTDGARYISGRCQRSAPNAVTIALAFSFHGIALNGGV